MNRIILASASPRRKEILEQIGVSFEIIRSTAEERITKTSPVEIVAELSHQKAADVAKTVEGDFIIVGADTIVAYESKILGKPRDEQDAMGMLAMLQGKQHEVYTGVTLIRQENGIRKEATFTERTEVFLHQMTGEQIAGYVKTGEPLDKAGSYGIQGRFAIYVREIRGDYNNVVGLPVARMFAEAQALGIPFFS